jgi:hypothetical protein
MNPMKKLIAAVVLASGVFTQAFAAGVFLVGDNNIFTTQQDNDILFQNIFNSQNVLIDASVSLAGLGTSATVTSGGINAANLAGQDYLMTGFSGGLTRTSYTAAERASIIDFVNGGGSLFLIGEYNLNFTALNIGINEVLSDIGSSLSLSLTENLIGAGPTDLASVTNGTVFGTGVNGWHRGPAV